MRHERRGKSLGRHTGGIQLLAESRRGVWWRRPLETGRTRRRGAYHALALHDGQKNADDGGVMEEVLWRRWWSDAKVRRWRLQDRDEAAKIRRGSLPLLTTLLSISLQLHFLPTPNIHTLPAAFRAIR